MLLLGRRRGRSWREPGGIEVERKGRCVPRAGCPRVCGSSERLVMRSRAQRRDVGLPYENEVKRRHVERKKARSWMGGRKELKSSK